MTSRHNCTEATSAGHDNKNMLRHKTVRKRKPTIYWLAVTSQGHAREMKEDKRGADVRDAGQKNGGRVEKGEDPKESSDV